MRFRVCAFAALLAVSGCATMGGKPATDAGDPALGASGNATMVGGLVGGTVGDGLGRGDRRKALAAEYRALEYNQSGQAVAWTGERGRSGEVVPAQPYRVGSQDCRQYSHKVTVDGQARMARGTACRNTDGSWATLS